MSLKSNICFFFLGILYYTFTHELAHAVAAMLFGLPVTYIKVDPMGGLLWGGVTVGASVPNGDTFATIAVYGAPYFFYAILGLYATFGNHVSLSVFSIYGLFMVNVYDYFQPDWTHMVASGVPYAQLSMQVLSVLGVFELMMVAVVIYRAADRWLDDRAGIVTKKYSRVKRVGVNQ